MEVKPIQFIFEFLIGPSKINPDRSKMEGLWEEK
jgi:hypothetical protein